MRATSPAGLCDHRLTVGAREQNKQARRERILACAVDLIARGGAEALTMREIARAAGLSEMTPYNLFGSKAGIIEAIFEGRIDEVVGRSFEEPGADPLDRLFASAHVLADTWTEKSGVFRELVRAARESGAELAKFSELPIFLLQAALKELVTDGLITEEVSVEYLARHIFVANQGAYDRWSSGSIDDTALRRTLTNGLAISLLGVASEASRGRILARIAEGARAAED